MSNPHLQSLLNKEMSRQQFLGVAALAVGSIFGFGTIIKLLTGKSIGNHESLTSRNNNGYGR